MLLRHREDSPPFTAAKARDIIALEDPSLLVLRHRLNSAQQFGFFDGEPDGFPHAIDLLAE